jgi:hypothetical protein
MTARQVDAYVLDEIPPRIQGAAIRVLRTTRRADRARLSIRGLAGVLGLAALLAGCGPSRTDTVAGMEAIFPILSSYGVTRFYRTDDCEYIVYQRGAFQTTPDCGIDADGPAERLPIDEAVRTDLDAIYRESERHGGRLQSAFPDYGPDQSIIGGSFGFQDCAGLIYEPSWTALPPENEYEKITSINADWYEVSCI